MIAIIPARGGSKGLPGKNIKTLLGKPLILYTIEAALKSKSINRIILSTDDKKIVDAVKNYNIEVPFLRPKELATDNALAIDNYIYTIDRLNKEFNEKISEFIVLQPTSPLRLPQDIDAAVELFKDKAADSVLSFCEALHPPQWAKKILPNNKIEDYFNLNINNKNRQELETAYMPNGAIFVFKLSLLKEERLYYSDKTFPYIMPYERSVDIDSQVDFDFAEFLMQKRFNEINSKKDLEKYKILDNSSIKEAIKILDNGGIGFSTVVNDSNDVVGIISDGDFRRAILSGIKLTENVQKIMNKKFNYLSTNFTEKDIIKLFNSKPIQQIPILDGNKLVEIITKDLRSEISDKLNTLPKNISVVIMAGGKGTRLAPFTHILPKALIPIGGKPIIEIIMDEYAKFGLKKFYISVNHKAKMLKAYFDDHNSDYSFSYIKEEKPLGTAGALKFLEGKIKSPFFVSNCDIIIKDDYSKVFEFHQEGNYEVTLVASMQHHTLPYGVCEIENGGSLKSIKEKPEYDILVNTGMYLINPNILKYIPYNEFFHITHLIEKLYAENIRIGVYPVSEKSWLDIGQWEEYKKTTSLLKEIA